MTLIALALAEPTTTAARRAMQQAVGRADLAELRLDLMQEFDLPALLADRPLPVIITCRPPREGGRWPGSEAARLKLLRQAAQLGADYVDLEGDAAAVLPQFDRSRTRIILSQHNFAAMPNDLAAQAAALWAAGADVVKVVGMAHSLTDCARAVQVLAAARRPTIALAMGAPGAASRILAFAQPNALLSFAAPDEGAGTAPGQFSLRALLEDFNVRRVTAQTRLIGRLGWDAAACAAANQRLSAAGHDAVLVPLPASPAQDQAAAQPLFAAAGVEIWP